MNEIQIYVAKGSQKIGPLTKGQVQTMLGSAEISLGDLAWAEGHESWKPLHVILGVSPPEPAVNTFVAHAGASSSAQRAYFYISTARLILMSVFSLGIFINYWVYKNWRYLQQRDGLDIMPFWRGWFAFFHFHSLLEYIKNDPKVGHPQKPDYSCGWLTCGFVVFTLCGNQILIPSMLTFLFILPAHDYISKINRSAENPPDYSPWTIGQVLCLLFVPTVFFVSVVIIALAG